MEREYLLGVGVGVGISIPEHALVQQSFEHFLKLKGSPGEKLRAIQISDSPCIEAPE
jgi:hypothetical protein